MTILSATPRPYDETVEHMSRLIAGDSAITGFRAVQVEVAGGSIREMDFEVSGGTVRLTASRGFEDAAV